MKRDFEKDRQICEAATEGAEMCMGDTDVFCVYDDPKLPEGIIARFERTEDSLFFAEALEGWPAALDEIEQLRAELDSHESWKAVNEATSRELQDAQQLIERLRKDCYRMRTFLLRLFDPELADILQDANNTLIAVSHRYVDHEEQA